MHNRLKIRTSVEMQAINKKKEQEKAAIYKSKFTTLLEKRKNKEYDAEILCLTAEILYMNPDVSTVWNIRKEYLLQTKNKESEDTNVIIDRELKLAEAGLRVNPKSYCAWYHRSWVLDNLGSESSWIRELQICTKYLELDERNFHCWDYRKYIVERLETSLEKELDYSLQKLFSNFSNYSAWHYRSKLLSRIYPISKPEKIFKSDIYSQEVSLVENAVYTDPNDQSAWFYYRWLLTYISNPVQFVEAGYDKMSGTVWIVIYPFSSSVEVKGFGNDQWVHLNENKSSCVFVKHIGQYREFLEEITLYDNENKLIDTLILSSEMNTTREVNFKSILTNEENYNLRKQLDSYQKLARMENDNKWALLATVMLKEKLGEEVENSLLEKLQVMDKYRKNYYSDLRSRHQIERTLLNVQNWCGNFLGRKLSLTAFHHNYFFTLFEEVDLSDNPLGNHIISKLDTFLSCKVLKLSNCALTSIDAFPTLPNLRTLNISQNKILCQKFPSDLLKCQFLEILDLSKTTISQSVCEMVTKNFVKINIIM